MHPEQTKIVERIIADLAIGVIPWRKQFECSGTGNALPYNAVSGRSYSGFNVMVLLMRPYSISGGWLTYKQAQACGGNVRKGEKSTVIFYYSKLKSKEKTKEGNDKFFMLAKSYLVFHLSQCDNIDKSKLYPVREIIGENQIDPATLRHAEADAFVAATGAKVVHSAVANAFYSPATDHVQIADIRDYETPAAYYSTLFHELIHWTGKRLGRDLSGRFASKPYGFEELIAELGACFTLPQFGMSNEKNNTAYLGAWIKQLKETPNILLTAASEASKANAFLNAFSKPIEAEEAEEISEAA